MKTIHHVVDIDAAADVAWAAITEPEGLTGWWSTELTTPAPTLGARLPWTFAGDFNPVMEITTLLCTTGTGTPFRPPGVDH